MLPGLVHRLLTCACIPPQVEAYLLRNLRSCFPKKLRQITVRRKPHRRGPPALALSAAEAGLRFVDFLPAVNYYSIAVGRIIQHANA